LTPPLEPLTQNAQVLKMGFIVFAHQFSQPLQRDLADSFKRAFASKLFV
jgi:hypothetical protein